MKYIAHRGNTNGRIPERENEPFYLKKALDWGFDIEVDVHFAGTLFKTNYFMFGHDYPRWNIPSWWYDLDQTKIWYHAKDNLAFQNLMEAGLHCFMHDKDPIALTNFGMLWHHPNYLCNITKKSIIVLPQYRQNVIGAYGICDDWVECWRRGWEDD